MKYTSKHVSIIVPIYKVEKYLPRCIDSLLRQTYPDFELILVDDGSPDGCGAICDRYAQLDSRIRVLHKSNGGLSDARNAGMALATGEYLAFVDSDDWVADHYLEQLYRSLLETGADICECSILHTAKESEHAPVTDQISTHIFETEAALAELIRDGVFHQYVWNKLYRRTVVEGISFEKGKTNEDEFWTYQVFGKAKKIARLHLPLYFYFQRPDSIMGCSYSVRRLDALEAKCRRQSYIEQNYPVLTALAKRNLHQSAIYNGQMTLLHLTGKEQATAKHIIEQVTASYPLTASDRRASDIKTKLWLTAASISFWGTCRLRNVLKRGF